MLSKKEIEYIRDVINSTVSIDQIKNVDNWIINLYNKINRKDYFKLRNTAMAKMHYIEETEDDQYSI